MKLDKVVAFVVCFLIRVTVRLRAGVVAELDETDCDALDISKDFAITMVNLI